MIATLGLMVAGLAAPLLLSPASARTQSLGASPTGQSTAAHQSMRAKPHRDLHDTIVKKRGKLYFKGRVDPGHGPVVVQKKACASKHCKWKRFTKVATHGPKEKWSVHLPAPRHGNWYWRGYVKAYGGYAKSWTGKWKTYTL
ncbi:MULTISPECIES: hypothetical protein [unclassified Nocardioides]|uniref:hypothetical protein n=1 Tax=unclassified Nocardioides TaxID=2615069 RepID=UPI0010549714|nr:MULTISPECIES: hypothetical protein [unclassified Nocardioides]